MKKSDYFWFSVPALFCLVCWFFSEHPVWNAAFAYGTYAAVAFLGIRTLIGYLFKI